MIMPIDGSFMARIKYYEREVLNINEGNIKKIKVHFSDTEKVKLIYVARDYSEKTEIIMKKDYWKIKSEYRKREKLKASINNF